MSYIGIDLGGTRIKVGMVQKGNLVSKRLLNAEADKGLGTHLPLIDGLIAAMMEEKGISALDGVAMAFPGLVNPSSKKVLSTNQKYDDATVLDIEKHYKDRWSVPFYIDNDARMAAVGEWKYGAGKGFDDIVMVTIGTGVGTSVIIGGKLLRGRHFQAGCMGGHFVVNFKGNTCTCGNIGCVEAEAASWNIDEQARNDPSFSQSLLSAQNKIDFATLFGLARKEDELAMKLRQHCLDVWAAGIISYIHAYDPELVVLGGGILNSANDILPYIQKKAEQHAWTPWGQVSLKVTELWDNAAIIGAAYCLQHEV